MDEGPYHAAKLSGQRFIGGHCSGGDGRAACSMDEMHIDEMISENTAQLGGGP